jgi:mannose-6-phosphate isomerase-like protein (cupin superfamily)
VKALARNGRTAAANAQTSDAIIALRFELVGRLSLQSHHHRAEHWIVVRGTAMVMIGEDVKCLYENESIYVPSGARHRLENPGKIDLELIEVQTGSYLGEDDIVL